MATSTEAMTRKPAKRTDAEDVPEAPDVLSADTPSAAALQPRDLNSPELYFNRELSWLEFNRRVLEEALDPANPLLERVKFLAIFSGNLDEFFMIRVSGLRRHLQTAVVNLPPDGMSATAQLAAIHERLVPMLEATSRL